MFFKRLILLPKIIKYYQNGCNKYLSLFTRLEKKNSPHEFTEDFVDELLNSDRDYQNLVNDYFHIGEAQKCLIIQPYVKWGPQKLKEITPKEQLEEAESLVKTLNNWVVEDVLPVPLENLDKKTLFKSGSLEKLKRTVRSNSNITSVFINVGKLKNIQANNLQKEFGVPILDRYKIVMQILRMHATTKHAKLQVAMAELYFMQRNMLQEATFHTNNKETLKLMFHNREQKLKGAIKELRSQRALLRMKRMKNEYPVVAVVGYTNAGKTSIIKALTGESSLQPKNQLFATLDVTMHSGVLPSGLEVLFVDTVGFISDIPTNLIECFVATLEDAVLADVILHVEDLSSSCFEYKRKHVLATLTELSTQVNSQDIMDKIISVGNKCDLLENTSNIDLLPVSSKTFVGLNELRNNLEEAIVKSTDRKKLTVKVLSGGDESRWLRKNATVISELPDEDDNQYVHSKIIITNAKLQQFKHLFI